MSEYELQPPTPVVEYDPRVPELVGVRWPARAPRRAILAGEVAMFDVEDDGELQEW